jgi:hypothetical protein
MTKNEATSQLRKGAIIRFQNSLLTTRKLTVKLDRDADVAPVEGPSGQVYAVLFGTRTRPADLSVTFGLRKVYCINIDRVEIVKGA